MNQLTVLSNLESLEITAVEMIPASVSLIGKDKTEKVSNLINSSKDRELTATLLAAKKGKAYDSAREEDSKRVRTEMVKKCSFGNYHAFAAWLADEIGSTVIINNFEQFKGQAHRVEQLIADQVAKGTESASKKATKLRRVHAIVCETVAAAHAECKARIEERKAKDAENKRLAEEEAAAALALAAATPAAETPAAETPATPAAEKKAAKK